MSVTYSLQDQQKLTSWFTASKAASPVLLESPQTQTGPVALAIQPVHENDGLFFHM